MEIQKFGTLYIRLEDFPEGEGKVIYKTVQARDDDKVLVNLDYDKDGKLVGIEILEHTNWEEIPTDASASEQTSNGSEGSDARRIGCSICKHCDGNMKKNCMLCIITDSLKGYEPKETTPKVKSEEVGDVP